MGTPNWSELNPDLLRCVFERLDFISLNRAKLVCSLWYSASRGCIAGQNQIPWLILFPPEITSRRCGFFVPDDQENIYRSKDFGVDFGQGYCMKTCGSWLLLINVDEEDDDKDENLYNLYILNSLTGERIDLPDTRSFRFRGGIRSEPTCFWIDNKTKDYLVVMIWSEKFIKKGYKNWQNFAVRGEIVFYNNKNQELYMLSKWCLKFEIWDFSGNSPRKDRTVSLPRFWFDKYGYDFSSFLFGENSLAWIQGCMAVSVSGDFLIAAYVSYVVQDLRKRHFLIFKIDKVENKWVQIDSLGDEALIWDLGITVIANGSIPGIKRNSIYHSGGNSDEYNLKNPDEIFVYDLTTQQREPLPQCLLSSMLSSFTNARWIFPG